MSLSALSSPLIGCHGRRLLLLAVALLHTCQLPTVAQDCGPDWCAGLYCTYGRAYDDNGCPLCDCFRPCENVTCPAGQSCEVVPLRDCSGRSRCQGHLGQCTVTTTRSPCPSVDCTGVYCPHGYVSDVNGCRTCQCRDLCERLTCPPGQVCKVTPDDCEPGQECRDGPMPYCAEIQESSTSTAAAPSTSTSSSSSYSSTRPTSPDIARSSTSTSTTTTAATTTLPSSSTTMSTPSTTTTMKTPSTTTSTYTTRTTTRSTTSSSTTPTTTTPSTTSSTSSSTTTTTTTTVPTTTSTTTTQITSTTRKPVPPTTSTTTVPTTTSTTTVQTTSTSTTRKPIPPTTSTTTIPTTTSTLPTTTTSKSTTSSTVSSTTTSKLSTPPSSTSTTTTVVRTSSTSTARRSTPALQTTTIRTESTARCPVFDCVVPDCPYGRVMDSQGCATCTCIQPCQEVSCPAGQTCKITDNDDTPYCDADNQLLEGIIRIDASYSIIDDMADFKQKMKQLIGSYLRVSSEHIIVTKVTKGSIVVYFGVDQQTDTSLEDVLARLERMNSTGVVVTYVGQTYDGRLVGFTATPGDSTGAPSSTGRQTDNYTFTLIVVLACVLGPLIIAIIIITVVILVVHKKSQGQVAISNRYQELRSVSSDSQGQVAISNHYQEVRSVSVDKDHTETGGTNNVSYVVDLDRSDRRKSNLETFA